MGSKSPLNNREAAEKYARHCIEGWVADNHADGYAVLAVVDVTPAVNAALADWDERMADPARRMPNGEPPNKRKELDAAIRYAIDEAFLA